MKKLELLLKEKQKLQDSLDKMHAREKELDKEIEAARMKEIFEESLKQGCSNAEELRALIIRCKKENRAILGNGGTNE